MSSLKTDAKSSKAKANLNTMIDKEVFSNFKAYCKKIGIPMNVLIETFMKQYVDGEFYLKFGKTRQIKIGLDDFVN